MFFLSRFTSIIKLLVYLSYNIQQSLIKWYSRVWKNKNVFVLITNEEKYNIFVLEVAFNSVSCQSSFCLFLTSLNNKILIIISLKAKCSLIFCVHQMNVIPFWRLSSNPIIYSHELTSVFMKSIISQKVFIIKILAKNFYKGLNKPNWAILQIKKWTILFNSKE